MNKVSKWVIGIPIFVEEDPVFNDYLAVNGTFIKNVESCLVSTHTGKYKYGRGLW